MIGTGYGGLLSGTCLAQTGNHVVCEDCDRRKIALLGNGKVPIYEPGWAELIARPRRGGWGNMACGRQHLSQKHCTPSALRAVLLSNNDAQPFTGEDPDFRGGGARKWYCSLLRAAL